MKRLYTVEFYRDMLARCREKVPGVAISSDFIVGFCGETRGIVPEIVRPGPRGRLQEQLHLQVQPAPRNQGPTNSIPTTCPEEVKKRRNNDLLAIQNAVSLADHRRRIGQTVEVLVEGLSKNALKQTGAGPRQLTGRTPDRSHCRLRRQRAAGGPDGPGPGRGRHGVHAVRHRGHERACWSSSLRGGRWPRTDRLTAELRPSPRLPGSSACRCFEQMPPCSSNYAQAVSGIAGRIGPAAAAPVAAARPGARLAQPGPPGRAAWP